MRHPQPLAAGGKGEYEKSFSVHYLKFYRKQMRCLFSVNWKKTLVKLWSRSGEGQVRVRKVSDRSESCEIKD